jgi:hypothetical protein
MREVRIISIPRKLRSLLLDVVFINIALIFSLFLVTSDIEKSILSNFAGYEFISYILSGVFAVNMITALPALAFQFKIVTIENFYNLVFFVSIGNVLGDLILFNFIKFRLVESLMKFFKKNQKVMSILKTKNPLLRAILIIAGGSIIISPLPDELGVLFLGFSRIKNLYFIPLTWILNYLGTFLILGKYINLF